MNLVIWHLRENLLSDDLRKIDDALASADEIPHPYLAKYQPKKPVPVVAGAFMPFERHKLEDVAPPPGWKSDEENWAGVQAFMAGRPG